MEKSNRESFLAMSDRTPITIDHEYCVHVLRISNSTTAVCQDMITCFRRENDATRCPQLRNLSCPVLAILQSLQRSWHDQNGLWQRQTPMLKSRLHRKKSPLERRSQKKMTRLSLLRRTMNLLQAFSHTSPEYSSHHILALLRYGNSCLQATDAFYEQRSQGA